MGDGYWVMGIGGKGFFCQFLQPTTYNPEPKT